MSKDFSKEKNDSSADDSSRNSTGAGEGSYKNVETSVNSPESFGDDYESQAEDELTEEEPKTEKDGRTGKS